MKAERDELGFDAPAPLGHPVRKHARAACHGPPIGERLPDFSVNDAFGNRVNFHEDRGVSKAALYSIALPFGDPLLDAAS